MIEAKLPHAELIDTATREVWQTLAPIPREQYDALDTPEGWHRVGLGSGAMDEHWFRRSPGDEKDGPEAGSNTLRWQRRRESSPPPPTVGVKPRAALARPRPGRPPLPPAPRA